MKMLALLAFAAAGALAACSSDPAPLTPGEQQVLQGARSGDGLPPGEAVISGDNVTQSPSPPSVEP